MQEAQLGPITDGPVMVIELSIAGAPSWLLSIAYKVICMDARVRLQVVL